MEKKGRLIVTKFLTKNNLFNEKQFCTKKCIEQKNFSNKDIIDQNFFIYKRFDKNYFRSNINTKKKKVLTKIFSTKKLFPQNISTIKLRPKKLSN